MAKAFDFRNSKSYFFLEQLLTASPVRTAGLENPNIVVKHSKKELRASQLRLLRALPNHCFLGPIPQLGTKGRGKSYLSWVQKCTAIHGPYRKDTELELKLLALTTPQGWGECAMQGRDFSSGPIETRNTCCGEKKVQRETNILDNVCFSKLDIFTHGNKKARTLFWHIWRGFSEHGLRPREA